MDYSDNTLDIAKKLLRGEDVDMKDVQDPAELKRLLSSNLDMTEMAADLFLQGQRIQSSISFDGTDVKIDAADVTNNLIYKNGASGAVITHHPNGELSADIAFTVGEPIMSEPPEESWSVVKSGYVIVLHFDDPENVTQQDIEDALQNGLNDFSKEDLLVCKIRIEFGDDFHLDYLSPSGLVFREDPQGSAVDLMDMLVIGEDPVKYIDLDDDTPESTPSTPNALGI